MIVPLAAVRPKFARESVHGVKSEILSLLVAHYYEIAHYLDFKLSPDWDMYEKAETVGALRVFTVRENEQLIGYGVFFVKHNLHYKEVLEAQQDILFIKKDKRGVGYFFVNWCDQQLAKENVQVVFHHMKAAHDFSPMLKRLGYELVDHIYARRLDR